MAGLLFFSSFNSASSSFRFWICWRSSSSFSNGTNFSVPVTDSATPWVDGYNDFKRGTGVAVASETDGKYNYILNVVDNKLGFYKAAGKPVLVKILYNEIEQTLAVPCTQNCPAAPYYRWDDIRNFYNDLLKK